VRQNPRPRYSALPAGARYIGGSDLGHDGVRVPPPGKREPPIERAQDDEALQDEAAGPFI
jgi:hypothetical protein